MATQTYETHRHNPRMTSIGFFFVLLSLVAFGLRYFGIQVYDGLMTVVAMSSLIAAVVVLLLISRAYTAKLQDRIIKLEMKTRCAPLLTPSQQAALARLTNAQIVALRFASDAELPSLVDRADREHLAADQIKRAIKNWVPDWDRT